METQSKYARFDRPHKVNKVGYGSDLELVDSSDEEVENDEVATVDWLWKYAEYIPWAKNKSTEEENKSSTSISTRLTKYLIICWRKDKLS
jgi:hypothetical protein